MVFSSLIFIFLFLPITVLIYYTSPKGLRNVLLFFASLFFYVWGEPTYLFIMIFSTVFDYVNGLLIEKYRDRKGIAKAVLINSIGVNIGILCFFKYFGFVVDNINHIFSLNMAAPVLPLPIGISFYTFQTMSYTMDVYLGKAPAQKNIITFGTYVAMFPQLVAGPIVKYTDVAQQLIERKHTLDRFGEGAEVFLTGLAKKVLLANNIGLLWSGVKATPVGELTVISAWLGIIAFTFQIYFDFSGYSDMARGLGKMFGFELMENFNYPYISQSATEFWRRWHISLGAWFREYLYIPLGGNQRGRIKQFRNIVVVWFLTGLWHGASWNFVMWGLYFGFFITIEKLFLLKWLESCPRFVRHVYTLLIVTVGWVNFEFDNLSSGLGYIGTLFGFGKPKFIDSQGSYELSTYFILLILLGICSTPFPKGLYLRVKEKLDRVGGVLVPMIYLGLFILSTAYLVNESYNPFLYFRF